MLRLTTRLCVELTLTAVFGFVGLGLLLGTVDEYRSGKAFNKAVDNYSARSMEDVHDFLHQAIEAKPDYTAPQEVLGKLLIDEGASDPKKYGDAEKLFEGLRKAQEAKGGRASLPVLIGLAVADLEATRAGHPSHEALRHAIAKARERLGKALAEYPSSGDLHVNLATVALLANDPTLCKRHLAKVEEVGDVSIDAVPFLYNLNGLAALRERKFSKAVEEFSKVKEFAPDWDVPRLNLASAYARSLFRGGLDEQTAETYARSITQIIGRLSKSRSPLLPLVCHALAVHNIRKGQTQAALDYFARAAKLGKLSWHARFNQAIGQYLAARARNVSPKQRAALLDQARPVFERALRSSRARRRDAFLAAAILGTIHADRKELDPAIAYFERAAKSGASSKDSFIREAMPRVRRSLAALYYIKGDYKKARIHLGASQGMPLEEKQATALMRQLRKTPVVLDFSAMLGKTFTDHDVRIHAGLAADATGESISPKDIRLTLVNETTKTTRPIPFVLDGQHLHALVLNLPQGRQRVELQLTDSLGNTSRATAKAFDIDREPPRVLRRSPGHGATVGKLETIDFRLQDIMGEVNLGSLSVMLKYPRGAKTATRYLVSHGKIVHSSKDNAIKKGSMASENVRCPVPDAPPPGKYAVTVRVGDVEGRVAETEWEFTLR